MFKQVPTLYTRFVIGQQCIFQRKVIEKFCCRTVCNSKDISNFYSFGRRQVLNVQNNQVLVLAKRTAGHSKWQNIKHVKAAKDKERATINSRCCQLIRQAIRDGGNKIDPKVNLKLDHAIDHARQKGVPNSTIETAIKQFVTAKESLSPFVFEIKGPGKCFLIVETLTDNVARTRQTVKAALNKTKCSFAEGATRSFFDYKGIINVIPNVENEIDRALNDAIEAGAEDVKEAVADDGKTVFQFLSEPRDFYSVKKRLEEMQYSVHSSGLQYIPTIKQSLSDEDIITTEKLFDLLEKLPEIVSIYDNIE